MKTPIIKFENFCFKYNAQTEKTLNNINLTIYKGEKILIVGPSGSGKSTLSNCINGLIPFSYKGEITGTLKINEEETKNKSLFDISQKVGTVLQDTDSQFIGLTVGEDIAFALENDCVEKNKMIDIVLDVSKKVDISDHLKYAPHELSGGQRQRVSLAGVMALNVDILLFDEPLANLDPATGKQAIDLIDKIKQELNCTIVIVEHRLEDVLYKKIDRIILINNGMILADTTPNEILSTNLLIENGIREPLYITALKYSGCKITKEDNPENIESLKIESYKENLNNWFTNIKDEKINQSKKTIVDIESLSFNYEKDFEVLKNVSFKIFDKEMLSIIGKNGAGKSTLAKLICGFEKNFSGDILLENEKINNLSIKEIAEKVGYVMQNPNHMISKPMIYDEVALGLKTRNFDDVEINKRVLEALSICGLLPFKNWPISALSYGQKKRVTIASVLVLKPKIIILDEPTAGQDFKHFTDIMEFLKMLNGNGYTIIMVTHDMHLMLEYTKRALAFSDGKLIADDNVVNIITNEKIIKNASLKETSLFSLAVKSNISDPIKFVQRFIDFDRRKRENG